MSPFICGACQALFLENDVILAIDGHTVGDDFTVKIRGEELVRADFLITGKRQASQTATTRYSNSKSGSTRLSSEPRPHP